MHQKKYIDGFPFIHYSREAYDGATMQQRSREYYTWMNTRLTCRDFSDRPVLKEIIENIVLTASTAPSGAHKQPWTFCVVSDAAIKKTNKEGCRRGRKRKLQQQDEQRVAERPGAVWNRLAKPFLETAPYLIVVFKRSYEFEPDGYKHQNYYVTESVGIACGFLLTAIHHAGLTALTHTPSPMNFLSKILNRPPNEKPFLLVPVGYAADECLCPI